MDTFHDLLDRAKARTGSDRRTAAAIGITQGSVSDWRNGKHPSDEQALKLAELVELDGAYVLALVRASRAKSDAARDTWRRVAQAFATVLVSVAAVAGGAPQAQAGGFNINGIGGSSSAQDGPKYALGLKRRRRKAAAKATASAWLHATAQALGMTPPRAARVA